MTPRTTTGEQQRQRRAQSWLQNAREAPARAFQACVSSPARPELAAPLARRFLDTLEKYFETPEDARMKDTHPELR